MSAQTIHAHLDSDNGGGLLFNNMKSKDIEPVKQFTNSNLDCSYPVGFFLQFLYTRGSLCLYLKSEEYNNMILGVISGKITEVDGVYYGHIYTLAVEPSARRLGLGSKLIDEFENKLKQECGRDHLSFLAIDIRANDEIALTFYTKKGFYRIGDAVKGYYKNHGSNGDALKLLKAVTL